MSPTPRAVLTARLWLATAPLASAAAAASAPPPARAVCDRVIVTADPAYPPLHWYDGHALRGASIDLTVEVLRRLGLRYEVRYEGPWKRVLALAEAGEVDMVVTLKDTPERRAYLRYVPTPAFSNPIAAFALKRRHLPYAGVGDLVGLRGGVSAGNELGGAEGRALAARLRLEPGVDAAHNFDKLKLGRIDYFATGYYTGLAVLARRADAAEFTALEPFLLTTQNYMAFVSASPCAKYLARFDEVLAERLRGGAATRALQANLEAWQRQAPTPP